MLDALRIPDVDDAGDRRLVGSGRPRHRARRCAADLRRRRRSAGVAGRPGLRRAGPHEDHVRDRRDAQHLPGHRAGPRSAARSRSGTFPIVCWRRGDRTMWGVGGDHAVGRHERAVAPRRPRRDRHVRCVRRGRGRVRHHRRRRLRPRADGPRHAAVGLRRSQRPVRAHPWARPAPRWCGPCSRAWPGAAPTSSRRPSPTPAWPSTRCASMVG